MAKLDEPRSSRATSTRWSTAARAARATRTSSSAATRRARASPRATPSTDFNLTGVGPADPGYAKLRGLVLLEGGGGSTGGAPLTADTLDRIEAKFDGGLFGAVRDNAPRCVDGVTPVHDRHRGDVDCVGQVPPKCTPADAAAYSIVPGLLNPRILAAGEATAIQAVLDPDGTENILRVDQGTPGNNAVAVGARSGHLSACLRVDGAGRPRQLRRRRRPGREHRVLRRHLGRRARARPSGGL